MKSVAEAFAFLSRLGMDQKPLTGVLVLLLVLDKERMLWKINLVTRPRHGDCLISLGLIDLSTHD